MAAKDNSKPAVPITFVITLLVAAAVGGAVYYFYSHPPSQAPVEITAEAKAYTRNLKLSEVSMEAHESYLGQEVVEIKGQIVNTGDRPLTQVDLNCVFYDPYGQVVLRQRVSIVRAKTGGLKPGETKGFRLPFEGIPASWNKQMPQLVIAGIVF